MRPDTIPRSSFAKGKPYAALFFDDDDPHLLVLGDPRAENIALDYQDFLDYQGAQEGARGDRGRRRGRGEARGGAAGQHRVHQPQS